MQTNINDQAIRILKESIKTINSKKHIKLQNIMISNEISSDIYIDIFKLLIGLLKNHKVHIDSVDLSNNYIGPKWTKAIAKALENNNTLTSINLFLNQIGAEGATAIAKVLEKNKKYLKKVAEFLIKEHSTTNGEEKDLIFKESESFTQDLVDNIKYFKGYQAVGKELLASELKANGIKDTELFLNNVDRYINEHLFQLSGVAKDPSFEILPGREQLQDSTEDLKDEKTHSFNPNDESAKSGSKRRLKEDEEQGSNKLFKPNETIECNIFNEPGITSLIAEFLGGNQSLFEIRCSS